MMKNNRGTEETKLFYDETGWKEVDGRSVDSHLFGAKEDGPIRIQLFALHIDRLKTIISKVGSDIRLLECGCGGSPATEIIDICSEYTGVDFSERGLELARSKLDQLKLPYQVRQADVCDLPFSDGSFDAVYCAQMIYHIDDPSAQEAALTEMLRVTKPGGVVVIISANPRPLLFPIRFARRFVADLPLVGPLVNRLRKAPPLPYKPMRIGWFKRKLKHAGNLEIVTYALPTAEFNRNVTEFRGVGKWMWRLIRWLDTNCPKLSAHLGSYILISVEKSGLT